MNMGRELTALAKWILGPIRWPVSVATWGGWRLPCETRGCRAGR